MMDLLPLLQAARAAKASDLHLQAGQPAWARVDGALVRLSDGALDAAAVGDAATLLGVVNSQGQESGQAVDFAVDDARFGRLRVHLASGLQGVGMAIRLIAPDVLTLAQLPAHPTLHELTKLRHGLMLFCGKAGSGKSTTLAAFVDHINRQEARHIVTLEDPIEHLHTPRQSLISQRQVGTHTPNFASGLREALRQDPDVIVVGELRDAETIALALQAADTGHLVLATLHASRVPLAVNRVVDSFGDAAKGFAMMQFADCLQAIVCQQLLPRRPGAAVGADGEANGEANGEADAADLAGRVPAFEILVATAGVRNLIRENKSAQLHSLMQVGYEHGMITMEDHLAQLRRAGIIAAEVTNGAVTQWSDGRAA
jgi:twitching motility protein PilT